ncbi:MAG: TetR/AcrR family transcriptional regulator [Christensenellales bacterium]
MEALTAKELGDALGSSARPIFTVFNSMKEVQNEVRAAAMCRFENFAEKKLPDMPLFKQVGMQMVLFGAKEPKLYQLLFMQENRNAVSFDDVFGELGPTAETCIGLIRDEYGMSETDAKRLFENVWIYTFGVGALCATRVCHFSE